MSFKNRKRFASLAIMGCFLLGLTSCDPITIHITTDGLNLITNNDDKGDENQTGSNDEQNDENQTGSDDNKDDENQTGSNDNNGGNQQNGGNQTGSNDNNGGNQSTGNGNNQSSQNEEVSNQKVVYVATSGKDSSSNGSLSKPYATIKYAAEKNPGCIIEVEEGTYSRVELGTKVSGTKDAPTVIRAAKGKSVKISGSSSKAAIYLHNVYNFVLDGFETVGGKYGIRYISDKDDNNKSLDNITIKNCNVHGVRGTHGICVYGENDDLAITNLTIDGNEVYDCQCGSSESVVVNGNIDGFLISNNIIHDNNNIGIDMIGFEGTAKHENPANGVNAYENDFVRNGVCRNNFVYNISTVGNQAYWEEEDNEYGLCAGGIYVDGGQAIEIYDNFIYKCNIGIEVATEHKPAENEIFRVSGIKVYDNIISSSDGFAGLCFGGYEKGRGFTEECDFYNNTLIDNEAQIVVQRSKGNKLYNNLIVGGKYLVELCTSEFPSSELNNKFSNNIGAAATNKGSFDSSYGKYYTDRSKVLDGLKSKIEGYGSRYIPSDEILAIYNRLVNTK